MKLTTILKRLKGFESVSNMESSRGNDVPNQFIINYNNGRLSQSYRSVIAIEVGGKTYLTPHWDYGKTTGKYRNDFLGENKKETKLKINSGEYRMVEGIRF